MTVNVYHKHSVVKSKAPDRSQLELGEVGINANQDSPSLYIKDSADAIIKVGGDIGKMESDIRRIKLALKLNESEEISDHESYEQWLTAHDVLLNTHSEHLEALETELEELKRALALLQAGDDQDIAALKARVTALEASVNQLAADINKIDQEQEQIKIDLATEVTDRTDGDVALSNRIDALEAIKIDAGPGIEVNEVNPNEYKIEIDKNWLEEFINAALVPYALKDISENTPELDGA